MNRNMTIALAVDHPAVKLVTLGASLLLSGGADFTFLGRKLVRDAKSLGIPADWYSPVYVLTQPPTLAFVYHVVRAAARYEASGALSFRSILIEGLHGAGKSTIALLTSTVSAALIGFRDELDSCAVEPQGNDAVSYLDALLTMARRCDWDRVADVVREYMWIITPEDLKRVVEKGVTLVVVFDEVQELMGGYKFQAGGEERKKYIRAVRLFNYLKDVSFGVLATLQHIERVPKQVRETFDAFMHLRVIDYKTYSETEAFLVRRAFDPMRAKHVRRVEYRGVYPQYPLIKMPDKYWQKYIETRREIIIRQAEELAELEQREETEASEEEEDVYE